MKHEYSCQNAVQSILDNMVPVPDYFSVNKECLYECDELEFIDGFKKLTKIICLIYNDMIKHPKQYGFEIHKLSDLKKDGRHFDLMKIINLSGQAGEIKNGELIVSLEKFNSLNKELKPKDRVSNISIILKQLNNFGFKIDGLDDKIIYKGHFRLSHTDDCNVIKVLKGYSMAGRWTPYLSEMNYDIAMDASTRPADQRLFNFSIVLLNDDRIFFDEFRKQMKEHGFLWRDWSCAIEYYIPEKEREYFVRCFSEEKKLKLCLRLRNVEKYVDYIKSLPSHIKKMFLTTTCNHCTELCNHRYEWQIDYKKYAVCVYNYFSLSEFSIDDVNYYIKLISIEKEIACG